METRANYVVIGMLALVAIFGAFAFVYWFQHSGGTGERKLYRVVFDGPAQGLRTGGTVLFNGIRVGEVTALALNSNNPKQVVATISVDVNTPVRADTKASLTFQGLTGIASLSLKGGAPNAPALAPKQGQTLSTIEVEADATQDTIESARETLRKIDTVLAENQESLRAAIKNIDTFTAALARNSERFDRIMAGIETLTGNGDGKGELPEAVKAYHTLAENLDKRTAEITSDVRRAVGTVERTVRDLGRNPQRLIFGNPGGSQEQQQRR